MQKAARQAKQDDYLYLTNIEKSFFGLEKKEENPYIVLKYYHSDFECFSNWNSNELKAFSDFIRKLRQIQWEDIYKTGGKAGDKTGFGYTPHKDISQLPDNPELKKISPDITFFELRVTGKIRVHGFRVKAAFFLVWLDRNHRIYPK